MYKLMFKKSLARNLHIIIQLPPNLHMPNSIMNGSLEVKAGRKKKILSK